MIAVQSIVDKIKSALDAENSDRYLFDQDFKPAINHGIDFIVTVFDSAFAAKKFSEENLRDLTFIKVWQANMLSRIAFDESAVGHKLWTIFAVFPKPECFPSNSINPLVNQYQSRYIIDKTFRSSDFDAKRLTLEEWNESARNPFMEGNKVITHPSIVEYAYLNFSNYNSTTYTPTDGKEIEVRPSVAGEYVAMAYLKYPTPVALITDNVEFPNLLTDMITAAALNWISWKQGDGTTLNLVSEKDVQQLASMMR